MKQSVRFQILSIVSLKLNSKYSFGVKCNMKDNFSASVQAAVQNSHEPIISSSLLLVTSANKHERSSGMKVLKETEQPTGMNHISCNRSVRVSRRQRNGIE